MTLMTILLILLVVAALWASMTTLLLRATIALALASALLAVVMYSLGAQIADRHFRIALESTAGEDDRSASERQQPAGFCAGVHAAHISAAGLNEVKRRRLEKEFDADFFGVGRHHFDQVQPAAADCDARRSPRRQTVEADAAELDAARFEPGDRRRRRVREKRNEFRIGERQCAHERRPVLVIEHGRRGKIGLHMVAAVVQKNRQEVIGDRVFALHAQGRSRVARVAAALVEGGTLEHRHAGTRLGRRDRRAQSGNAAADDDDIETARILCINPLHVAQYTRTASRSRERLRRAELCSNLSLGCGRAIRRVIARGRHASATSRPR